MEYLDEEMIALRKAEKKKQYTSFKTGFYINDEVVAFHYAVLFEKKMGVMLPRDLRPMPDELAKMKYPSESRPQVILSNADHSVNFTFSLLDAPMGPDEAKSIATQFQGVIQTLHPANIFYDFAEEAHGSHKLAWFDYQGYALDGHIYYIMYALPIEGKMMHGLFNCGSALMEEWKVPALEIMRSIADLTEKKEDPIR